LAIVAQSSPAVLTHGVRWRAGRETSALQIGADAAHARNILDVLVPSYGVSWSPGVGIESGRTCKMTIVYFAALRTETSIRLSWWMVLSWRQLAGAELKISSLVMHGDLRPSPTFYPWKGRHSMLSWRPPRYRSFAANDEVNPSLLFTKLSITDPFLLRESDDVADC
jgi:hypothetical protein